MKKYLTFVIFTVLIITSCSQNLNKDVNNGEKAPVEQAQVGDTHGELKAVGGSATDDLQGSEATGESDFNIN